MAKSPGAWPAPSRRGGADKEPSYSSDAAGRRLVAGNTHYGKQKPGPKIAHSLSTERLTRGPRKTLTSRKGNSGKTAEAPAKALSKVPLDDFTALSNPYGRLLSDSPMAGRPPPSGDLHPQAVAHAGRSPTGWSRSHGSENCRCRYVAREFTGAALRSAEQYHPAANQVVCQRLIQARDEQRAGRAQAR